MANSIASTDSSDSGLGRRSEFHDEGAEQEKFFSVREVQTLLRPIAEKWKLIGTELKVDPSVLAMIESEHDTDVKKLFQMLEVVESQKVLNKQILYEAVSSPQVMEQEIAKKVLIS